MRTASVIVCMLIGLFGLAVYGFYDWKEVPKQAAPPSGVAPREETSDQLPSGGLATTSEVDRLRDQLAELSARIDSISNELAGLRQGEDRVPVLQVQASEQSSEEAFRALHERTILAILSEEREALALEARAASIRSIVDGFWKTNDLPELGRVAVADTLIEGEKRYTAMLHRIVPDGRYPAPDSAEWKQLGPAEDELSAWRRTELSRFLDSVELDELVLNMRSFGGSRY